jgi:hypothetical protein
MSLSVWYLFWADVNLFLGAILGPPYLNLYLVPVFLILAVVEEI